MDDSTSTSSVDENNGKVRYTFSNFTPELRKKLKMFDANIDKYDSVKDMIYELFPSYKKSATKDFTLSDLRDEIQKT